MISISYDVIWYKTFLDCFKQYEIAVIIHAAISSKPREENWKLSII